MATQRELLKCKTKAEVKAFAQRNGLPTRTKGNEMKVGGWTCVFNGDKFSYIK